MPGNVAKRAMSNLRLFGISEHEMPVIALSGGFDCVHAGHIRMIEEASKYGRVHVYLNSDAWLMRKKGYVFQDIKERYEILSALRHVNLVIPAEDDDGTVCETLKKFKPAFFGNGGDRGSENTPELTLCLDLGIKPIFGLGGEKIQSSSDLVKNAQNHMAHDCKREQGIDVSEG